MRRRNISMVFIGIIFIVAGGTWYYCNQNNTQNEWDFVPKNAFVAYKKQNTPAESSMLSDILSDTSLNKTTSENNIHFLKTIYSFFVDIPVLISFHYNNDILFDIMIVFSVSQKESEKKISTFLQAIKQKKVISPHERKFRTYIIKEIQGRDKNHPFFYSYKDGFFIGSFESYLVEEALIVHEKKERYIYSLSHSPLPPEDYVIINTKELQNIFSHISLKDEKKIGFTHLFEHHILLEKMEHNSLFTGYMFFEKENYAHWNGFKNNVSTPLTLQKLIPQRSTSFLIFNFTSGEQWGMQMEEFWKNTAPDILKKQKELEALYKIDLEDIHKEIQHQVAFISFSSNNSTTTPLGLIIEAKNNFFFSNSFDKFKTTDEELYRNFTLKKIEVAELPALLFGEKLKGFPTLHYTYYDNYLLAANNILTLKVMIEDISQDRTFSNTYSSQNMLPKNLASANVHYFVNIPQIYGEIKNKIQQKWKQKFDALFSLFFQNTEAMSLQMDNIQEKSYTVLSLFSKDTVKKEGTTDATDTFQIHFSAPLITAPTPFQSTDGSIEFLTQDSTYILYSISDNYQVLWQDSLDSEVTSPFFEVNHLPNEKKQYAFTTHKYIYIIEKNGTFVPPFPINVSYNNDIEYFQVIQKDAEYQYIVVDKSGLIFCITRDGKNQQDWTPQKLPYKMSAAPAGVFVENNLYLVATTITGEIHILNQNKIKIKGFPIFLNTTISNPIHITDGQNASNTFFSLLTDNGILVSANMEGKIAYHKNFYRGTKQNRFQTITDKVNNTLLYAKIEKDNVTLLDQQEKAVFEAKLPFSQGNNMHIRYFHFHADMGFLTLKNKEENISYLIHQNTGLFYKYAIESNTDIEIFAQNNDEYMEYFMIYAKGRDVILQKIHLKDFSKDIIKKE